MRAPMQDNTNDGVGELQDMRSEIGEAKECRVCKYVLLFSFLVLLSVMTLVYFQGKNASLLKKIEPPSAENEFRSIPPSEEDMIEESEVRELRLQELDSVLRASDVQ